MALVIMAMVCAACKSNSKTDSAQNGTTPKSTPIGNFDADSAYQYIADQVAFGPRIPGSDAHRNCRDWLVQSLKNHGADSVIVQEATVKAYNGDVLPISNIIAGFNIRQSRRVLLVAHWDTRPWADHDNTIEKRHSTFDGANDGGSGVGVLLEIARNLGQKAPSVGVDIMFTDAEDYGNSDGFDSNSDTWCLGSKYWSENIVPYRIDNLPVYGILLDMVGGRNAVFHYEAFSTQNAATPTIKVWSEAEALGYGDRFPRRLGGAVTDDHINITNAGIPTTDIIELNNIETQSFPPTWHTLADNMSNIDKSTLKAVGQTVLNVVYKEKPF